jgi:uncharacterized protein (TIGR02270 family)
MIAPIIPDIVEEHWEEAGFLWALRCAAARKPSFSLHNLAELDERVEAHLDGLRVSGQEGWALCRKVAAWEEAGEAFTFGVIALERADEQTLGEIWAKIEKEPKLTRGLISAFGWVDPPLAQARIPRLLASESPVERFVGISAAAINRLRLDGPLLAALKDSEGRIRARACRAVGELGRDDLASSIAPELNNESEAAAFWAAWSLALLRGDAGAMERLRNVAFSASPWQYPALELLLRRSDFASAGEIQKRLAKSSDHVRLAIIAAGIVGDPALVPWLCAQMSNLKLMRLAADTFQTITGADFVLDRLRKNSPPRPPVPEDEGGDAEPDLDGDLTWPEPAAIQKWWDRNGGRFKPGARYFLGKPVTIESLGEALAGARQHQRASAALELAIRQPGQPLFETRAKASRQQKLLAGEFQARQAARTAKP